MEKLSEIMDTLNTPMSDVKYKLCSYCHGAKGEGYKCKLVKSKYCVSLPCYSPNEILCPRAQKEKVKMLAKASRVIGGPIVRDI